MKMVRFLSAALFATLVSCKSPQPPKLAGQEEVEKDKVLAAEFRAKNARWIVPVVPKFDRTERTRMAKQMILKRSGGLQLELNLGDRWKLARQYGPLRTESRYRLTDSKGKVLASAESTLAAEDLTTPDMQGRQFIRIYRDPVTGGFLIEEEQSWATHRYVTFRPGAEHEGWKVNYFHRPDRPGGSYTPDGHSAIVGFYDGLIYFACDSETYAIPVEEADVEDDLGYSIG